MFTTSVTAITPLEEKLEMNITLEGTKTRSPTTAVSVQR